MRDSGVVSLACVFLPLIVTVVFMLVLRPVARSVGLIDKPGGRKAHTGEIPVIGGIAMMAGVLIGGAAMSQGLGIPAYPVFLAACLVIAAVGVVDDRYNLPPSVRFLAQGCAAITVIYGAHFVVKDLGEVFFGSPVQLIWISPIFTLLIILAAINAYNMFDGSDGIAGIQALNALVFLGFVSIMAGSMEWFPVILNFLGVVVGFLIFNWPSRRTRSVRAFMGDAGSTMLGFSLACIGIALSQGDHRAVSPIVVLWIFMLPIFDFFSSMLRRVWRGRSPFHADAGHLHHILKRHFGMTSRRIAQLIFFVSAVMSGIGVASYLSGINDGYLLVSWLVVFGVYHLVFGTRVVIKNAHHFDGTEPDTGSYQLWKPRRKSSV